MGWRDGWFVCVVVRLCCFSIEDHLDYLMRTQRHDVGFDLRLGTLYCVLFCILCDEAVLTTSILPPYHSTSSQVVRYRTVHSPLVKIVIIYFWGVSYHVLTRTSTIVHHQALLPPLAAPKNLSRSVPLFVAAAPTGELLKKELPSKNELLPSIPKLLLP